MFAAAAARRRAPTRTPAPTPIPGPTFCAEWVRQSNEGYDRLTVFRDGDLVWKTSRGGKDEVKREKLSPAELQFYCEFFARTEIWTIPKDRRTGLTGQLASSLGRHARAVQRRPDHAPLRRVLDGHGRQLLAAFRARGAQGPLSLSAASGDAIPSATARPGTLLKRFDGAVFQVRRLEKESGFVEIVGMTEPYSQFIKIEELRFQFAPPEVPR